MVGNKEDREVGMAIFIEKYDKKAGLPVNTAARPLTTTISTTNSSVVLVCSDHERQNGIGLNF